MEIGARRSAAAAAGCPPRRLIPLCSSNSKTILDFPRLVDFSKKGYVIPKPFPRPHITTINSTGDVWYSHISIKITRARFVYNEGYRVWIVWNISVLFLRGRQLFFSVCFEVGRSGCWWRRIKCYQVSEGALLFFFFISGRFCCVIRCKQGQRVYVLAATQFRDARFAIAIIPQCFTKRKLKINFY